MKIKVQKDTSLINTDIEAMSTIDKFSFLKGEYTLASKNLPDYTLLKSELSDYIVAPPMDPDYENLSEINRLYATAQSFASRVTTIEMISIDNESRWQRIVNAMDEYIEDKKSALLVSEELSELTVAKANAQVRVNLKKDYGRMQKLKKMYLEAASFTKMVTSRKKDLAQTMMTLGRQVKALSLDQQLNR